MGPFIDYVIILGEGGGYRKFLRFLKRGERGQEKFYVQGVLWELIKCLNYHEEISFIYFRYKVLSFVEYFEYTDQ